MHPVLKNTYLLKEILEHLGENFNTDCYDAALRELFTIRPLLGLVPTFKLDKTSNTWVFETELSKLDLEILHRFGHRVRRLTCFIGNDNDEGIALHSSVPIVLASALAGQPLLPTLQHLHFSQLDPGNKLCCTGLLHVLHSTNLRDVYLRRESDDEAGLSYQDFSFISRLSKAPFLRKLEMFGFFPDDTAQEAIKSLQNLSTLEFTFPIDYSVKTFPWSLFSSFSGLQHLCILEIQDLKFDDAAIPLPQHKLRFVALQRLTLICSFETMSKLLRNIQLPALKALNFVLEFHDQHNPPHFPWTDFFQAMSSTFGPKFSDLEIQYSTRTTRDIELVNLYMGVPFDYINRHLFSMRLRKIKIRFPIIESVSIDHLEQIFKAWPTLTVMHLETPSRATAPGLNPAVLSLIAQHLPQLHDLHLRIDTTHIPGPPFAPSPHPLKVFSLQPTNWAATTKTERKLASFLDSVFPCLQLVYLSGVDVRLQMLSELGDQIHSLQAARARERRMLDLYESTRKARMAVMMTMST